jgi:hypothetical protein
MEDDDEEEQELPPELPSSILGAEPAQATIAKDAIVSVGALELACDSFSHKRPMKGGPTKATAYLRARHASGNTAFEQVELSTHGREGDPSGKQRLDSIFWHATGGDLVFLLRLDKFVYDQSVSVSVWQLRTEKVLLGEPFVLQPLCMVLVSDSIMVSVAWRRHFVHDARLLEQIELGSFGSDHVKLHLFNAQSKSGNGTHCAQMKLYVNGYMVPDSSTWLGEPGIAYSGYQIQLHDEHGFQMGKSVGLCVKKV